MRRSLVAVHVVALALWLGSLVFSAAMAPLFFITAKHPVCPACMKPLQDGRALACEGCFARHHEGCSAKGCGLDHPGPRALGAHVAPASSALGASTWTRVRLAAPPESLAPERRLLWRIDAASPALRPEEVRGACFELPRPAAGDALARSFAAAHATSIAFSILALVTAILTPPGGGLRLFRALAVAGGLALAGVSISKGRDIGTGRYPLEAATGGTAEDRAAFDRTHEAASRIAAVEALLVLVALSLATVRREEAPKPTS